MIPAIEQKYGSILKNIEELYYEVDLAGNLTFSNDSMSKILGYAKDELIGMNNRQYMDEETSKKVYQMFNQVYQTGVPAKAFDWELIGKDGTRRILETSVSLMHDSEGRPIGFYGIGRDITERKRTENALRQSEKRYHALFEGSRDAIYVTTQEGEIVDANQSMLDLFGYCGEEMMGLNVRRTYVYPEDRRKFQQQIEREGFVRDYEIKLCKKDGTEMECLLTASVRRADDGGILGYQGIIRDVTEHKQMLNALRIEKQRLQTLSENAPFGMVMIDQDGTFRYINPKFKELFGYDLTDVPDGKTWFRKAYPDSLYRHDVISVWKEDLSSFKPGEKRSRVFTVTRKDGTEKIINFIPVQLETDENLMACEDITEREQAEAALRQSEEKYRTILNSIEEGYYEVDIAGNLVFFNQSLAKILGYRPDELIGINNRKYMSAETSKRVFDTFNEVYRTGKPSKAFDWELIRKDGTVRYVETSVSAVCDSLGRPKGFRGIARDITELKSLDKARERVINHLSHEVRTPLSIIGGVFAGVTRQLQKENLGGLERTIERGTRSVKRLLDLQVKVDDILNQKPSRENDGTLRLIESALGIVEELKEEERVGESARAALELFSRRLESVYETEAIRWEKIDAAELVREVVQEAGLFMGGRDVEIHMDVHAGLALEMDRSNLKKVCRGLLRNAIENTPDEGKVEIQAVSREKSIHFSFRDYGLGITEQNQKMIFGGFFHNRDTSMYSSKDRYQFQAGGTGADLLRTKVFSERYKFQVGFESRRCRFLPRDEDACPGRISKCSFVKDRGECFSSGGSTFSLAFPQSGGL